MNPHRLVAHLHELSARDDRATLAALRRASARGAEATVYPVVARFFPTEPNPWLERALVELAQLFVTHPNGGEPSGKSIGAALRAVSDRPNRGKESIEGRFVALLDSHRDELCTHLRHAISLARADEVAIDWNDVLDALLNWGWTSRSVQRRWAREFWGGSPKQEEETP